MLIIIETLTRLVLIYEHSMELVSCMEHISCVQLSLGSNQNIIQKNYIMNVSNNTMKNLDKNGVKVVIKLNIREVEVVMATFLVV